MFFWFLKIEKKINKNKFRNDTNRELEFLSFILFIMNIFIKMEFLWISDSLRELYV